MEERTLVITIEGPLTDEVEKDIADFVKRRLRQEEGSYKLDNDIEDAVVMLSDLLSEDDPTKTCVSCMHNKVEPIDLPCVSCSHNNNGSSLDFWEQQ